MKDVEQILTKRLSNFEARGDIVINPALDTYLEPFNRIFAEDSVNEIIVNNPGEVFVEKMGEFRREFIKVLDMDHLVSLAKLIAQSTNQFISEESPILSATLPNGYRVQVVMPPAASPSSIGFAIRKGSSSHLSLDDYERLGVFDNTEVEAKKDEDGEMLKTLLHEKQIKKFLVHAISSKKNIIVSGGTSTGKTTFINAALSVIPSQERIITIEDAREVRLPNHANKLHLLASKGGQGKSNVTTRTLIEACLRLRPDRIIVGELRGSEAFSFLRAINTGHPGSISSLHADNPSMAVEQLKLMVMQADLGIPPNEIKGYVLSIIDIIIQLKRGESGKRYVSEIFLNQD